MQRLDFRILGASEEDRIMQKTTRLIFMKCAIRQISHLAIGTMILSLLDLSPVIAEELTLVRLSFWVPPEQLEEFNAAYEEQVIPVLKEHGLVEFPESGRIMADSVFSRLFEIDAPALFFSKEIALQNDPTWNDVLIQLGANFGTPTPGDEIRYRLHLLKTTAGLGRVMEAGIGERQKLWHTLGVPDGLPSPYIVATNLLRNDRLTEISAPADRFSEGSIDCWCPK